MTGFSIGDRVRIATGMSTLDGETGTILTITTRSSATVRLHRGGEVELPTFWLGKEEK